MDKIHAEFLRKCKEAKKLTNLKNEEMLLLYAYYKQATQGNNTTPKPTFFNFKETAKWNAWKKKEDVEKVDAMKLYSDLVKNHQNDL